ncbi:Uncharacterised protein [Slackia heliotrinireducens]|uniref:Uncharacterized protein n=1 Tax=Slackia heliotrinireducens (strain ATCC 29202 / DSM 20476 / NCTC 11029 / RHS 1) TaxID=471855 RepID=C7N6N6_SLAHD|nr:hypothetical protein [Slackia heliotrinireducens]ACV22571.1 hypothetical protein Shel_15520 [Slackia heliotrinireducens DSM 20476]VEH01053.1 Uncharacterised protein [Slackia heliotrinireducens]
MTAKVTYRPNKAFARTVLNDGAVCALADAKADEICARAVGMYDATGYSVRKAKPGKKRCHAFVHTADMHAVNSNRVHSTLLKSI